MSPALPAPDLRTFFAPAAVAFVGATEDMTKFGGRCLRQMLGFGYAGRLYPVNPRRDEIAGRRCYPSVLDLPEVPDHVGILVPADKVLGALEQCAQRGVRFATVFSGGFSETGSERGRAMQAEIRDYARAHGMRIMGPNCNGVINFVDGFAMTSTATISGPRRAPGNVGVVANSGGLGQVNVMWRTMELGIGVAYEVSCGNDGDLDALDFARWMVDGDQVDVVLMALEAIRDGAKLVRLAERAAERRKPIVMLKFGRSDAGRRAAFSHTGALTGADEVHDAALRQCGIIRVDDTTELCEMAMLLRTRRLPSGRRVASMSLSGGNVVHLADGGARYGLEWSEYAAGTQEKLRSMLPSYGTIGNPTDLTSAVTGVVGAFQKALEVIAADPGVDTVIPTYTFARRADVEHGAALSRTSDKAVVVLWTGGCTDDPDFDAAALAAAGTPVFRDTLACLRSVRNAAWYAEWLDEHARGRCLPRVPATVVADADRVALTEREAKALLARHGLRVTQEELATDADAASAAAAGMGGAVALKIESPDILHKTDIGAVALGLRTPSDVRGGFDRVMAAARAAAPQARLNGVLVQEMVTGGMELILGVVQDATFGPVVMAGFGGVHAEVLRDVAYRLPPVDGAQAREMLRELRAYRLLEGVRGAAPRDIDAVMAAIERLSAFALAHAATLLELDINPLMVLERGRGAVVVDALVVNRSPS